MTSPQEHAAADLAQAALQVAGRPGLPAELALAYCREAARLIPDRMEPIRAALGLLEASDGLDCAGEWADQGLKLSPADPGLLIAKARALELGGAFDLAAVHWRRAHAVTGGLGAELGRALLHAGDLLGARHALEAALALAEPGSLRAAFVQRTLGETLLKAGLADGFGLYRARDRVDGGAYRLGGVPTWEGEALAGKRLLITHQLGFGDQLLLTVMVAQLTGRGAALTVTCDPPLRALLAQSLPAVEVIALERPTGPDHPPSEGLRRLVGEFQPDAQASLLGASAYLSEDELRAGLATRLTPASSDRTWAARELARLRQAHLGKRLIGLAFDCVQHRLPHLSAYDRHFARRRSVPQEDMARVTGDPEIGARAHFVCLHPPDHLARIGALPANCSALRFERASLGETAAVIAELDAVISVDTVVATLFALMGRPGWVVLNHAGEWRWGNVGEASPWLPGPRLLRQPIPGVWAPVLARLKAEVGQAMQAAA